MATIADAAEHARVSLLAVAVMSNHLHIVAQQRDRPLSALMQPVLRILALRIQTTHDFEGPVFWRPFASQLCMDPSHARNAIVYTHLNPVRAGLCDDPAEYRWTSQLIYDGTKPERWPRDVQRLRRALDPAVALPLFATAPRRSMAELREDYRAFVAWRLDVDRTRDPDDDEGPEPPAQWHRSVWGAGLSPLFHAPAGMKGGHGPVTGGPDLAALARGTLASEAPGLTLESIRGRGGGQRACRLRHLVVHRLHRAGFRNVEIARFLGLSESAVSWIIRKRRHDA
jgi:REP element-mobilizing transposase RayT